MRAAPCKTHDYVKSDILDYVADMNVLLSYANMLDDWDDDGNLLALFASGFYKPKMKHINRRFPKNRKPWFFECLSLLSEAERGADESRHSRRRFRTAVGHSSELPQ